jgi:small-conductance mechanosensitive channel
MDQLSDPGRLLPLLGMVIGELLAVIAAGTAGYLLLSTLLGRLASLGPAAASGYLEAWRGTLRRVVRWTVILLCLGLLAGNTYLVAQGIPVLGYSRDLLAGITREQWIACANCAGVLIAIAIAVAIAVRLLRALLRRAEGALLRLDLLKVHDQGLTAFFSGLDHALVNTAWLLMLYVAVYLAGQGLPLPAQALGWLASAITIYLVIAVGVLVIRATTVIVETLDTLSRGYAEGRGWLHFYDRLRPLVPLFRRCLEAALWTGIASLVVVQLSPIAFVAHFGAKAIQLIGLFFLGRVVIEVGYLAISRGVNEHAAGDDQERRRRATLVPLLCSVFRFACYFAMLIVALPVVGQDPTPFLAGLTALSVVVGFGAQSMIADLVSGFFIIFENVYLVGDIIEGAGAHGQVEEIAFRTTRIRDQDGRLHIIRNGDMKQVVNYSKDYVKAVVPIEVPYQADVRQVFAVLLEAGARLQAEDPRVLSGTEIDGITGFGGAALTIRTATKVKPGSHLAVASRFRLLVKEAMDARAAALTGPRVALVPALLASAPVGAAPGAPPPSGPG